MFRASFGGVRFVGSCLVGGRVRQVVWRDGGRAYTRCTSPGCKCRADPPEPHGPYWQWTRKIDGKTVTRRLTPAEAKLYRQWIANDRRMKRIIEQMRTIAAKAADIHLTQTPTQDTKV